MLVNKKIYICTIVVSLVLMLPACFFNCGIVSLLSGVGCSGFAAAIMAIFLDSASYKREQKRQQNAKTLFFKNINNQITMLIERVLWFNDRIEEPGFNWEYDVSTYSTLQYMIAASREYESAGTISFDNAVEKLNIIGTNYDLDHQANMSPDELKRVQKMFSILAYSCSYLLSEVNSIKENRLALDVEGYMTLEQTETLAFETSFIVSIMAKPQKNYGAAITSLITIAKLIRAVGNYNDSIRLGLHGSFSMNEI